MIEDVTGRRLKTTQASLEILRLILEHDGLTLSELDAMVDSSKSSICSHLNTLLGSRYVVKEGETYHVSFRVALLGERARHRYPDEDLVEQVVDRLARATGREANFTIFEHGRLLICYSTSPDGGTDVGGSRYRSEYHLHNTAAGKAILAELDRSQVESIIDGWGLPRESEKTVTDRDRLFEELDDIADQRYAVVDEEFAPELVAIGAPVHDEDGSIIGGLSVGGLKSQVDASQLERECADELLDAVESLESLLTS